MKTKDLQVGEEYAVGRSHGYPMRRARIVAIGVDRKMMTYSTRYRSRTAPDGIEVQYLVPETGEDFEPSRMTYEYPNPLRAQQIFHTWEKELEHRANRQARDDARRAETAAEHDRLTELVESANEAVGYDAFFVRGERGRLSFPELGVRDLEDLAESLAVKEDA